MDLGEVGFQAKKTPSAQDEKMLLDRLNDIDDDGHGGYGTSGVRLEHVSATLWPLSFRFNLAADIS